MNELKPCPFCGSDDVIIFATCAADIWLVSCHTCEARTGKYKTKTWAVEGWNRRPEGGSEMKKEEREEKVEKENKCTVTLNENLIKKAIADFLRNRGLNVMNNNEVVFSYFLVSSTLEYAKARKVPYWVLEDICKTVKDWYEFISLIDEAVEYFKQR